MVRTWSLVALGALALMGCGSEDDSSGDPRPAGSAVLTAQARVLDEPGLRALRSFAPDGTLVFSGESPVLSAIAAGDVLIVSVTEATPNGALVKVENVTRDGRGLVVTSRRATLAEAFEELHVDYETVLAVPPPRQPVQAPSLGTLQQDPVEQSGISFPLRLEASDSGGSALLDGAVSLAPTVDLTLDVDFVPLRLAELSLSFGARETFVANFSARGSTSFDESVTLASIGFSPIIIPIPTPTGLPVPLVLTPNLSLGARVQGTVQGDVETGVVQEAGFEVGLGYKNGSFGTMFDHGSKFKVEEPTYQAGVSVKAAAGPRFEVLLWGLVGPYATAEAYVELAASAEGPPACARGRVDAGLSSTVGVDILADYRTTLFNQSYPLASFDSCTNDPNAPRPAATWARTFGREGSPGERAKAVVELRDGSYLVVGDSDAFEGTTGFAASMWAVRVDALGNVMWQRAYWRLAQQGLTQSVVEVEDGVLVLGNAGIMKLDVGGNVIWAKTYSVGQPLELASIAARDDGSLVIAGKSGTRSAALAMGLDRAGDVVWSRNYAGNAFARVRITSDGGAVLIGQTDSSNGDMYVVKLDAAGNVAWQRALDNAFDSTAGMSPNPPASSNDSGLDIAEKPGGGFVAVGESYGGFPIPEPGQGGYFVAWEADLASDGSFGGGGSRVYRATNDAVYTTAYAVAVRPDGSSLIVGRHAGQSSSLLQSEDILLIQGGTLSALGGSGNDAVLAGGLAGRAAPLVITSDGGAILAATSTSFAGQDQFWVVKLNRTANINFPYRTGLSGPSYTNKHARSTPLSSPVTDVAVSTSSFEADVRWEVTPVIVRQQAP